MPFNMIHDDKKLYVEKRNCQKSILCAKLIIECCCPNFYMLILQNKYDHDPHVKDVNAIFSNIITWSSGVMIFMHSTCKPRFQEVEWHDHHSQQKMTEKFSLVPILNIILKGSVSNIFSVSRVIFRFFVEKFDLLFFW